jgi:formylglycine-generating enzyme required for sulfatase activity
MIEIEIEMIEIPNVTFKIGKYPITQKQYQEVMGNNPSYFMTNPKIR